jgi:hypothetical protein
LAGFRGNLMAYRFRTYSMSSIVLATVVAYVAGALFATGVERVSIRRIASRFPLSRAYNNWKVRAGPTTLYCEHCKSLRHYVHSCKQHTEFLPDDQKHRAWLGDALLRLDVRCLIGATDANAEEQLTSNRSLKEWLCHKYPEQYPNVQLGQEGYHNPAWFGTIFEQRYFDEPSFRAAYLLHFFPDVDRADLSAISLLNSSLVNDVINHPVHQEAAVLATVIAA